MSIDYSKFLGGGSSPTSKGIDYSKFGYTTPKTQTPLIKGSQPLRTNTFSDFLGGGVYVTDPNNVNKIINQGHTTYGDVQSSPDSQRDDIVPVGLNGVNTDPRNIKPTPLKAAKEMDKLETSLNAQVKAGKIGMREAQVKIKSAKQVADMEVQGVSQNPLSLTNLWKGFKGIFTEQNVAPQVEPKTALEKVALPFANVPAQNTIAFTNQLQKSIQAYKEGTSTSKMLGENLKTVVAAANLGFTPITSAFSAAENLPGPLSWPAKAVGKIFEYAGKAVSTPSVFTLNNLPISQESKDNLRQPIEEISTLIGQVLLGGKALDMLGKGKTALYDKMKDNYVKKIDEVVKENPTQVITPEVAKNVAVEAVTRLNDEIKTQALEPKPAEPTPEIDYNKFLPEKPSTTDPLTLEAQKYKTAEEFVNNELAKRGEKLPTKLSSEGTQYGGQHEAPMSDSGSPIYDLGETYPEDIYSSKGVQYYGDHSADYSDQVSISKINEMRNHPDKVITVYRAVPKDTPSNLNSGDWVSINRDYAKSHGESSLNGNYKIISKQVYGRDIYTDGNSIHEFGYDPQSYTPNKPIKYLRQSQQETIKSQLTDIWNKANNEKPLSQDPTQFKSAEEFVKGQTPVFRASEKPFDTKLIGKEGVFVSPSENIAGFFGEGGKRPVEQLFISPEAKVLKWKDIPDNLKNFDGKDLAEAQTKIKKYAKNKGYDVVGYEPQLDYPMGIEHQIVNPDVIKTKSQLTDIWNKAQTKVEAPKELTYQQVGGQEKVTRASAEINKTLVEKGFNALPEDQQATFDNITKAETIQRVSDMMNENIDKSVQVALGKERSDLTPAERQVLFNSVAEHLAKTGDYKTLAELAKSPIATERSLAGQTLGSVGFNKSDSISRIMEVNKHLENKTEKKTGGKSEEIKKNIKEKVKSEAKKSEPKIKTWADMVKKITC